MQLISKKIVDETWPEVDQYNMSKMMKEIKRFGEAQPHIMPFIMTFCQDLDQDAKELALYLTYVLFRMVEKGCGKKLPQISPEKVIESYDANEKLFESMEGVDDRLMQRWIRHAGELKQPHLIQYVVEALYEEDEDVELDEEIHGYLFLLLKTVIDAFEGIREESVKV